MMGNFLMGLKVASLLQQAGKALTTGADDVAKYAKACGKRSILETRHIKNLNPKELGVCLPDGSIYFQTEKAAQNYARNICMKQGLLPPSEQFEVAILRQKNRILGNAAGNHLTVDIGATIQSHRGKSNLVVEHYHPDIWGKGNTYPLSIGADSYGLGVYDLEAVTAYNSLGQYSTATRLPNFNRRLMSEFSHLFHDKVGKLAGNAGDTFIQTKEYRQFANKFWLENAEKHGMKYSTNMDFSV